MMNIVEVEGNPNLVRDTTSQAVINRDINGYNEYMANVKRLRERNAKIDAVADEVTALKNEISEIKQMLVSVLSSAKQ